MGNQPFGRIWQDQVGWRAEHRCHRLQVYHYRDNICQTGSDGGNASLFSEIFGNPSSIHAYAREAKKGVDHAREQVAQALHAAKVNEVYFTSGGSESDNWALKGVAEAQAQKGKHIITTQIEHHAILHTCEFLEKHGYEVTYLPVDEQGFITPEQVAQAIRPDTILVSIMFANNEIGTIQPIAQIGEVCHAKGVTFHTDAVQAFGSVPIDVQAMHIDLLSLSGHKIYGPKGVGALYIRNGVKIAQFLHGGAQERGRRATTENVPGIVGLGKAAEIASAQLLEKSNTAVQYAGPSGSGRIGRHPVYTL